MLRTLKILIFCSVLWAAGSVEAARPDVYVPEELKEWQDWVLKGREYIDCPFFSDRSAAGKDNFVCVWPGHLNLSVDDDGGRFNQRWTVYATDEWVPLPGDTAHWPQQVTVDGQLFAVVARGEIPSVRLSPGQYEVSGRFEWNERPSTLRIPAQSGLLALSIGGERIERPDRNLQSVWLGEREQERRVEDAMQVQVYRLVTDDVPTRLTTVLQLEISGSVREELIGPMLPSGFTPMAIDSELPTRLEADGFLLLQVRPGSWQLALTARADSVLGEVISVEPETNLPTTEIWSFLSNDTLRVSVPGGLTPVDPMQVGVPDDWEELPGFRVDAGDVLTIAERSRGKIATENLLSISRQMWLDFDGNGFVFSDSVSGRMRSEWRLDMERPFTLLSAAEDEENLLVTQGAAEGLTGIEVRQPDVYLEGLGRTESRGEMPVTGWRARFDNVNATLHLPPGNKLLAAVGSDRSSTSWINRWRLLDFFLVLIISVSAARLFGREAGVLSLLALTLSLHEPGAPEFIWLNLLVAVALVRVAPAGRLQQASKTYRNLSLVVLLIIFIPFAAGQLRIAIYPQLESQGAPGGYGITDQSKAALYGVGDPNGRTSTAGRILAPSPESTANAVADFEALEEVIVTGTGISRSFSRYAPNAIVQVGPGRPDWQWNSYRLNWSGPVEPDRTMRLVIMPRWLVTALRFIEVVLLAVLAAVFIFEALNRRPPWQGMRSAVSESAASVMGTIATVVLASALLMSAPSAHADTPSDAILKQLEQRLLEQPPCVPNCAEIIEAGVVIEGDEMTIRLTTNALDNVALALPGSLQGWRPEQLLIDNVRAARIYNSADQSLWLHTPEGRHEITLQGPLPPVDSLEIPFPTIPRVIRVESSEWFVAGIDDRQLLSGSLQLTRLQQQDDGDTPARWESSRFPVFSRVERTIDLDLDWRVTTTVHRIAPRQGAITVNIPLLPGEAVSSENFTVTDGEILVSMDPAQQFVSWQSTLPRQSPLSLQARANAPWKEVWSFAIGSIWNAGFAGVPESETDEMGYSHRIAQFYPRSGESLELDITRPEATTGDTMVFEEVRVSSTVGARSRTSELALSYRSTRGAQHAIRLPQDAEIVTVAIDGSTAPLRAENGELSLPILPGEHEINVVWRTDSPVSLRENIPVVELGAGASNIHANLTLPANRWVIAAFGPRLGPSVLYWSELVVLLFVAFVLGRLTVTPLRTHHWLLLGLGFSTFSWYALLLVVVWLLASGVLAESKKSLLRWRYNGVQIAFAILSIVALITIVVSLPIGLLGSPDMHVVGNGSFGNRLNWFHDRSEVLLPTAFVLSLPLWVYKGLILAWSLWLSFALLRWLPWVWKQFAAVSLWKPRQKPLRPMNEST